MVGRGSAKPSARGNSKNSHVGKAELRQLRTQPSPLLYTMVSSSLVEVSEGTKAHTKAVRSDGGRDFGDSLASEEGAAFDGAAVLVRASVDVGVMELVE